MPQARVGEPASRDGLRLLYVVNGFPWPLTSGYLRHFHFIRELAGHGHRISLLAISRFEVGPADVAALEPYTERIVALPSDRRDRSLKGRSLRRLRVISGGELAARQLRDAAVELRGRIDFDVAVFSGIRTYPVMAALDGLPVVADVCDAASSRVLGSLRYAPAARWPLLGAELIESRLIERALVKRSAHTLYASVRDRAAVIGLDRGQPASVVPNGVDLDYWRRPPGALLGQGEIVLSGAMDYPPNTDAALHLIRDILPRVRTAIPDAHVTIVGRDPTPALLRAGQAPGVTVTGFVPDVRPYLVAASVSAAPLRFGAGIQNKVLESLAMQVPTVASSNAADGLVTAAGAVPPVSVADDSDRFASALIEQLRATETNRRPPVAGRAYVERQFSWSRSGHSLDTILREVARDALPAARRLDASTGTSPLPPRRTEVVSAEARDG